MYMRNFILKKVKIIINLTIYLVMSGLRITIVWIGMSSNHPNDEQAYGPHNCTHEVEGSMPHGGLVPPTIHSRHVSMGAQRLMSSICTQWKIRLLPFVQYPPPSFQMLLSKVVNILSKKRDKV